MSGFNPSEEKWRVYENRLYQTLTVTEYAAGSPVGGGLAGVVYAFPYVNKVFSTMGVDATVPYVWGLNNSNSGLAIIGTSTPNANATIWVGDFARTNGTPTEDPWAATGATEDSTTTTSNSNASPSTIGSFGRVRIASAICALDDVGAPPAVSANPTADTKSGIGFGVCQVVSIPASPAQALILLYCDYLTMTWKLLSARGGGSAPTAAIETLQGVDPPQAYRQFHMRLVHDPIKGKISGWINGVEGAIITDTKRMPLVTGPAGNANAAMCQFSCFAQSGTAAAAAINAAYWYPTEYIVLPWR